MSYNMSDKVDKTEEERIFSERFNPQNWGKKNQGYRQIVSHFIVVYCCSLSYIFCFNFSY